MILISPANSSPDSISTEGDLTMAMTLGIGKAEHKHNHSSFTDMNVT